MKKFYVMVLALLISVSVLAQVERKVIIEHFTNTRCGICAIKNPSLYQTLQDYPEVLHIAYHPSSPYSSCVFNLHNSFENDQRAYFYDVYGGTPRVVIQGEVVSAGSPLISTDKIVEHLGKTSKYEVSVLKTHISGSTYKMTINIERVAGNEDETILLYSGIAEKEVEYSAPNGENMHHDVFRKKMFYDTVNINPVGNSKSIEMEYTIHADWNENEIFAFAVVHNSQTFEVEQSASSLDSPTEIFEQGPESISGLVYPNPASVFIQLMDEYINKFDKAELYTLTGNRVGIYTDLSRINVSGLTNGMYFLKLTDKENNQYSTRIIKTTE